MTLHNAPPPNGLVIGAAIFGGFVVLFAAVMLTVLAWRLAADATEAAEAREDA